MASRTDKAARPGPSRARGILATLAGAGAAAAVLGLGLLAGLPAEADSPAAPPPASLLPEREGAGEGDVRLGDRMTVFGQSAQMGAFWTADKPHEVLGTYESAWKKAGFDPQIAVMDKVGSVSFVDPATGLLRSVTVLDQDGETMVMPAIADAKILPDTSARTAPVPVPENARAYMAHTTEDPGSVTFTATYLLPIRADRAVEFYRWEMKNEGYGEGPSPAAGAKGVSGAEFKRGPETVTVLAAAIDEHQGRPPPGGKIGTFVIVTHTRALAGGEP